ncbi:MAG: type VII secretion protein EccB [Spirillospora sp.]
MATKRDQLQAYRFIGQRVSSALVSRETDPEQPPFRRVTNAAIGGLVIAAIALLVMYVYGIVSPGGNTSWRDGRSVIVVKETGTRYVYLNGRLHPVHNYTSALLALGDNAKTLSISRKSLVGVTRGPAIGIPDAPDALPDPDDLLRTAWTLCSRPTEASSGAATEDSTLLVGTEPTDGQPLGDQALLLEVPASGDHHLVWRGYRHRIDERDTVDVGLALDVERPVRVDPAVVDILPAGDEIAPIKMPDAGTPSTAVPRMPKLRTGQVLVVHASNRTQHFIAEPDRLRRISELQYEIQLAYKGNAKAYNNGEPKGVELGLVALSEAAQRAAPTPSRGAAPSSLPTIANTGRDPATVCATFDSGSMVPRLRLDAHLPNKPTTSTPGRTPNGLPVADHVYVPPGQAALTQVMPSGTAPTGTLLLVTDQGRAHPLASREVLGILGYSRVDPVLLPAGLVARVPQGSALAPAAGRST